MRGWHQYSLLDKAEEAGLGSTFRLDRKEAQNKIISEVKPPKRLGGVGTNTHYWIKQEK